MNSNSLYNRLSLCTLVISAIFLSSCAKEAMADNDDTVTPSQPVTPELPKFSIRAEISPLTKTTLIDDEFVYWTDGDIININGLDSDALDLEEPVQTTDFDFTGTAPERPYKAVYPSTIYAGRTTVNLPHEQDYVSVADGTFASNGYDYMCAYAAEGNPIFEHLTCVVRVTVKSKSGGTTANDIASVEFMGGAQEQVSGHFTLNHSDATLTSASNSFGDQVVGVYPATPLSTDVDRTFNISVPAKTYASGFTIKITDSEGHFVTKTKSSSVGLYAGHIHPMSALAFNSINEENEIIISSGSALNTFATKYNNGEYPYDANAPLVVRVSEDIALTAEEATAFPGIGNGSYPFKGTFDGQDHTISGFNTTKAMFPRVENEGVIKNLNLSGAMTAEAAEWVNSETYWQQLGTVCNYLKGTISHVSSSVNLTIASKTLDNAAKSRYTVGGIVGFAASNSLIEECTYSGTLSHDAEWEDDFPRLLAGGIIGLLNNVNVVVRGCTFSGAITIGSSITYTSTALWNIGGIAGYHFQGNIVDCSSSGNVTVGVSSINKPSQLHVGGVCGHITYNTSLTNVSYSTGTVQVNMAGYPDDGELHIGGVAGYSELLMDGEGEIANSGTVKLNATASWNESTSTFAMGGVIGYLKRHGSSGTNISGLSNSGLVQYTDNSAEVEGHNLNMGGVIGWVNGNGSVVSISHCDNGTSARVHFNTIAGNRYYKGICVAGIIGDGSTPLNISYCSNSGSIDGGNNRNGRSSTDAAIYFAGIAGHLASSDSASSSISDCSNNGDIYNDEFNNVMTTPGTSAGIIENYVNIPLTGGIIAFAEGCSDNPVSITRCSVNGIEETNSGVIRARRGVLGGIVGYARYASISDCENKTSLGVDSNKTNAWHFGGGICGIMNASSLSNCSVSLFKLNSSQAKTFGGICGVMDIESSISSSSFKISQEPTMGSDPGKLNGNHGYAVGWTTVAAADLGVTNDSSSTWNINKIGASK